MTNKLSQIVKTADLEKGKADQLMKTFGGFYQEARGVVEEYKDLQVKSVDDSETMQTAREARLKLRKIRVEADKTRKSLKEQSIREGRAIQGVYNIIEYLIKPVEEKLLEQEKYAERIQAEQDAKVEAERHAKLSKYTDDADLQSLHPKDLSSESFEKLLETYRFAFEAKKKAEAEAEKERLEKIEAEKKEQERIRKENERLKAEAEKREKAEAKKRAEEAKKLAAEKKAREEAEAKLKAEKEAREREEREIREAAEAKKRAEEESKRKALLAPDKDKLFELQKQIAAFEFPAVKTNEAQEVLNKVKYHFEKSLIELRRGYEKL